MRIFKEIRPSADQQVDYLNKNHSLLLVFIHFYDVNVQNCRFPLRLPHVSSIMFTLALTRTHADAYRVADCCKFK